MIELFPEQRKLFISKSSLSCSLSTGLHSFSVSCIHGRHTIVKDTSQHSQNILFQRFLASVDIFTQWKLDKSCTAVRCAICSSIVKHRHVQDVRTAAGLVKKQNKKNLMLSCRLIRPQHLSRGYLGVSLEPHAPKQHPSRPPQHVAFCYFSALFRGTLLPLLSEQSSTPSLI